MKKKKKRKKKNLICIYAPYGRNFGGVRSDSVQWKPVGKEKSLKSRLKTESC